MYRQIAYKCSNLHTMQVNFESLLKDIKSKKFKPVYVLAGEESYYIDEIVSAIEEHALNADEKEFNQSILYGQDIDSDQLLSECKLYPMMAERRVVIVKEAKSMKGFSKLTAYMKNPVNTTILVLAHKHAKLDGKLQVTNSVVSSEHAAYLISNQKNESDIVPFIQKYAREHEINFEPQAAEYLKEFMGTDLGKIVNEIGKLSILVGPGNQITHLHVLENVGLNREFNIFELQKALAGKNLKRAVTIANYLGNNKNTRVTALIISLFGFYTKGLLLKYETAVLKKSFDEACNTHGIRYGGKDEMQLLMRNYNVAQLKSCIRELGLADLYAKGVNAPNIDEPELLRNLVLKFLY